MSLASSAIVARTSSEICSAFEPGAWKMGMATADLLSSSERRAYSLAPSSMRATSLRRVTAPSARSECTMSPNSSCVVRRPCALTRDLVIDAGHRGRGADDARGHIDVLLADGVDDIARGEPALGHFARIEPDAHGVVAGAKKPHVADAGQAREPILDVDDRVIAQVGHVIAVVGREQVDDHGQVGRTLHRRHAELLDFLRQTGQRLVDPVLHQLLGEVGIGAQLERDGQRHQAVRGRLATTCRACSPRRRSAPRSGWRPSRRWSPDSRRETAR